MTLGGLPWHLGACFGGGPKPTCVGQHGPVRRHELPIPQASGCLTVCIHTRCSPDVIKHCAGAVSAGTDAWPGGRIGAPLTPKDSSKRLACMGIKANKGSGDHVEAAAEAHWRLWCGHLTTTCVGLQFSMHRASTSFGLLDQVPTAIYLCILRLAVAFCTIDALEE